MSTAPEDRLLAEIRRLAVGRRQVKLGVLWEAFQAALPQEFAEHDGRANLRQRLDRLAAAHQLRLPRGTRSWDAAARPELPAWIELPAAESPDREAGAHRRVPWAPELAFVAEETHVEARLLGDLLAIQRFLAEGGRERPLVPYRERSAELFGDEKRLDVLRNTLLYQRGNLGFALLRCSEVPLPLAWERCHDAGSRRPLLVVENLHTYASFRQWNERVAAYSGVVYGNGRSFTGMRLDLARICGELEVEHIEYFGDLDADGLKIPYAAAQKLSQEHGLALVSAERWYRYLLERGVARRQSSPTSLGVEHEVWTWFPAALRPHAQQVLAAGLRLPQELVGTELLATIHE